MKKLLIGVALIIGVVGVVIWLSYPKLVDFAIKRQVRASVEGLRTDLLEDGKLHVIVVGSGSPAPDPYRVQTCVAVIADNDFLLFDAGGASAYRLGLLGLPAQYLTTVFFTHLHSDHISDLPLVANLGWRHGRKNTLNVYGPAGTEAVVNGFNQAHRPDLMFRHENTKSFTAPVETALPVGHEVTVPSEKGNVLVYEGKNGLRVYAFLVDHRPVEPAFGYRIEYKGCKVVISGDTCRCENVAREAQNADILIHEAYNKKLVDRMLALTSEELNKSEYGKHLMDEARGVQHYHTSPVEAAEIAAEANVQTLVFTHIIPPLGPPPAKRLVTRPFFLEGVSDAFKGKFVIAEDGMQFDLPLN